MFSSIVFGRKDLYISARRRGRCRPFAMTCDVKPVVPGYHSSRAPAVQSRRALVHPRVCLETCLGPGGYKTVEIGHCAEHESLEPWRSHFCRPRARSRGRVFVTVCFLAQFGCIRRPFGNQVWRVMRERTVAETKTGYRPNVPNGAWTRALQASHRQSSGRQRPKGRQRPNNLEKERGRSRVSV